MVRLVLWSISSCRLPQLDRIPLRVIQTSEAAVRINLLINVNRYVCLPKLGHDCIEISDPKIDHP